MKFTLGIMSTERVKKMTKEEIEQYFNNFSITLPNDNASRALYFIKVLENETEIKVEPTSKLYKSLMCELQVLYNSSRIIDRTKIAERLVHSSIEIDYIPYMIIYSQAFIDEYFSQGSPGMKKIMFDCLNSMYYNHNHEYDFLRIVKSNQCTIEDYIKEQLHNGKDDKFFHIIAVHLYTAKRLDQKGIEDYRICINNYNPDKQNITHGSYHKNVIYIYCTPGRTLHKMVHASEHEIEHADQEKNRHYLFIENDPDIDIYTKDKFLKQYEDDYYDRNYSCISYEYDADFKARMTIHNLETKQSLFHQLRRFILKAAKKEVDVITQIKKDIPYAQTAVREYPEGTFVSLDEAFEIVLKKEYQKSIEEKKFPSFRATLANNYQIILYEYVVTENDIHRKTIPELIDCLYRAKTDFTEEIYKYLIASATDPRKHKNYKDNLKELEALAIDEELPQKIKKLVKECLDLIHNRTSKEQTLTKK